MDLNGQNALTARKGAISSIRGGHGGCPFSFKNLTAITVMIKYQNCSCGHENGHSAIWTSFVITSVGFYGSGPLHLHSVVPSICHLPLPGLINYVLQEKEGTKMAKILFLVLAGTIFIITFVVCFMALMDYLRK